MASETIADGTNRIIHKLDLSDYGINDIPSPSEKEAAKEAISSFLENEILRKIDSGVSPVAGEGRFQRLNPEYAVRVKGGQRLSNLENEGDLKDSFLVRSAEENFLEIGHVGSQVPKADGHNQLSSKAKTYFSRPDTPNMPRRRYIPDSSQKFTRDIEQEIRTIINEFVPEEETTNIEPDISSRAITPSSTQVTLDSLFSDDVIDLLLAQSIERRNNGL